MTASSRSTSSGRRSRRNVSRKWGRRVRSVKADPVKARKRSHSSSGSRQHPRSRRRSPPCGAGRATPSSDTTASAPPGWPRRSTGPADRGPRCRPPAPRRGAAWRAGHRGRCPARVWGWWPPTLSRDPHDAGGDGFAVHDVVADAVLDPGHDRDLFVERLGRQHLVALREQGHHGPPGSVVAERPQRGVVTRRDDPDATDALLGREHEQADGPEERQRRPEGAAVGGPHVAAVVDEARVLLLDDRRHRPGLHQPPRHGRAPAEHVHDEVGRDLLPGLRPHPDDPGHGTGRVRQHAGERDAPPEGDAGEHRGGAGDRGLDHRSAGGEDHVVILRIEHLGERAEHVEAERPALEERGLHLGELGGDDPAEAGQQEVGQAELAHPPPLPFVPRGQGIGGRRRGVPFEHRHGVPVLGQQHRCGESTDARPAHHDLAHRGRGYDRPGPNG